MFFVKKGFHKALSRGYEFVYIAIDIHDTIIPGNRTKNNENREFYPYAKEVLQNLSKNPKVKIILYSCSHKEPVDEFISWLEENDINVAYYNENPDHPSNDLCDFSKKFFFDILFDDKAGWVAETDWKQLKNVLIEINQWMYPSPKCENYKELLKKHQKTFGELWNADENCWHEEDPNNYSGIRCVKCKGWFCY